jgi:hypothetical protein
MQRREFVTLLGSAAVTWAALARAQQATMPTVGFLSTRSPDESAHQLAAFHRGLAENGYVENQNVTVEYRWAMGQYDQMAPLAAELVRLHVGHCRLVERDGFELIHSSTISPVVFRSVAAAKVAAIYFLQNGFENWPAVAEGWHWGVKRSVCPAGSRMHLDPVEGETLPDAYEVGRDDLDDHLQKVFGISSAADENLLLDIHAQERIWTFRVPDWSTPLVGRHYLRTVRRSDSPTLLAWLDSSQGVGTTGLVHQQEAGHFLQFTRCKTCCLGPYE